MIAKLDVSSEGDAKTAVKAAVEGFGRIDVLVNNAANFYAGYFEEFSAEEMNRQIFTTLIGPMNVTRAVLPVMRKQRSGHIISISSLAGLVGIEFGSAYAASKFGFEGWMPSPSSRKLKPFGINATIVNPGFFRTESCLQMHSTKYAGKQIEGLHRPQTRQQMEFWKGANGQQPGDPAKLAKALITIASEQEPSLRFIAGADAVGAADQITLSLQKQIDAHRELSSSLAY